MAIDKNIVKPISDKIPSIENKKATENFVNNLTCRLMDIADSIDQSMSLETCKSTLLFRPENNPDKSSHVDIHMPVNGKSNDKLNIQINAMNTMLQKKKTTNSCFLNEHDGYETIIDTLMERADEITEWLQDNSREDRNIILTTKEINDIIDPSQNKYTHLGYGFIKDSRGHIDAFESQTMTVVLRKNDPDENNPLGFNGLGFHVHTAYPGQRQSDLYNELQGIDLMPDEKVTAIIKKTPYYKNATNMNKVCMEWQTSKKVNIPSKMSIYYDPNKDAIGICCPYSIDKSKTNAEYVQTKYFIKKTSKNSNQTVISALQYTKDATDSEADWKFRKQLQYPQCASENMSIYLSKMQTCIERRLTNIDVKRSQKAAKTNELTADIKMPNSEHSGLSE